MRSWFRTGLVVVALGSAGSASAQDSLIQRDGQGPVTVAVTLAVAPALGVPIRATVVLDTHSVALDSVVFDQAVVLRTPDGAEVAPTGVEGPKGSGHHREAVVMFSPVTQPGMVRIVVKNAASRSGASGGSCRRRSELRHGRRLMMAKDPVCGMTVDEKKAAATSYKGQTYYFCSTRCKTTFDKAPEKYGAPGG